MNLNFRKSDRDIFHNMKIKSFPDGEAKITVASKPIFKEKGYEPIKEKTEKTPKYKNPDNEAREDSIRRAKTRIDDIVRLNDFMWFVTLTIDPDKLDSKNINEVREKVTNFLSNAKKRKGLRYILVAEFHKSGAIHLHGFINDSLTMIDSGTVKVQGISKPMKIETARRKHIPPEACQTVYNVKDWRYGFSTAYIVSDDRARLSSYFTKYITKDCVKIFGKYYLAGGELLRDAPVYLTDTEYPSFIADNECYCPQTDTHFKYLDTAKHREEGEQPIEV